jgi:hypothetical protein
MSVNKDLVWFVLNALLFSWILVFQLLSMKSNSGDKNKFTMLTFKCLDTAWATRSLLPYNPFVISLPGALSPYFPFAADSAVSHLPHYSSEGCPLLPPQAAGEVAHLPEGQPPPGAGEGMYIQQDLPWNHFYNHTHRNIIKFCQSILKAYGIKFLINIAKNMSTF